jgi:hypothetical protein
MTHAEFLAQTIAEIAEELPGFEQLDPKTQQTVRELANEYFHDEYIPRLEGRVNIPRYQTAIDEKTPQDREYIADQSEFLRSNIIRAQRAAYSHLLEKFQPRK